MSEKFSIKKLRTEGLTPEMEHKLDYLYNKLNLRDVARWYGIHWNTLNEWKKLRPKALLALLEWWATFYMPEALKNLK